MDCQYRMQQWTVPRGSYWWGCLLPGALITHLNLCDIISVMRSRSWLYRWRNFRLEDLESGLQRFNSTMILHLWRMLARGLMATPWRSNDLARQSQPEYGNSTTSFNSCTVQHLQIVFIPMSFLNLFFKSAINLHAFSNYSHNTHPLA